MTYVTNERERKEDEMKNIDKYSETKDALEAYEEYRDGGGVLPLSQWLECEYEEPIVKTLLEAADMMEREKDEALHSTALKTHETNFDRFAFIPEMEHGAQIATAFSFYLEEQYPPKLRGGVCMDRAYYDFLLWLFSAPGKKGATK